MLVEKLKSQGVILSVNGDKLVVDTAEPLTDKQRDYLRSHKAELMAELSRECHMWSYLLDPDLLQYTRMGLMTDDIEEARRQLLEIYGRPVEMLHLRQEPKEITTKTEDGRILITAEEGSYLWSLGGGCDFVADGKCRSFANLDAARSWVSAHIEAHASATVPIGAETRATIETPTDKQSITGELK